ncbi:LapA family protein [bacterium]|nr:LapA family protein [bacterium]MBU1650963.1 LapA family protein [bacterium]
MWIARIIAVTVIVLVLVGFLGLNMDELVDVNFLFWESPRVALAFALFFAFALGMLVHLLVSIGFHISLRSEIGKQKRQIKKLQVELEKLRNLSIEDDLISPEHALPPAPEKSGD